MTLLVMMIRLQQSVFLTSTTKASVYTARNFAVRHYVILGLPFMYLPFGTRSIAASDWDLFSAFVVTHMTYTTATVSVALLTTYQETLSQCLLGIAYNRETTNTIQVIERFRITFIANARFKLKISLIRRRVGEN